MRKLFQFLINHASFIVFLILEAVSFLLIINFNNFQKSVYFNSANVVVGTLNEWGSQTTAYFDLPEKNEQLAQQNATLQSEVFNLQKQLEDYKKQKHDTVNSVPLNLYKLLPAKVINNSINKAHNYITLNIGAKDGVKPDMGVINSNGVVGIVSAVSDHFSLVISLLNPYAPISCKFKQNGYSGLAVWDGNDYRYMQIDDIMNYVPLTKGDTVVTSGYGSAFPEGIPIGVVDDFWLSSEGSHYEVDVKLFANFRKLSYVSVIDFSRGEEQQTLEETEQ